jgi:hypothetical protein
MRASSLEVSGVGANSEPAPALRRDGNAVERPGFERDGGHGIAVAVQPQTQVAALHNVVPKAPVVKVLRSGGRDGCAWWAVVPVLLGSVQLD